MPGWLGAMPCRAYGTNPCSTHWRMQPQVVRQQDSSSIHIANSATSLVNCSLWIVYFVAKGNREQRGRGWQAGTATAGRIRSEAAKKLPVPVHACMHSFSFCPRKCEGHPELVWDLGSAAPCTMHIPANHAASASAVCAHTFHRHHSKHDILHRRQPEPVLPVPLLALPAPQGAAGGEGHQAVAAGGAAPPCMPHLCCLPCQPTLQHRPINACTLASRCLWQSRRLRPRTQVLPPPGSPPRTLAAAPAAWRAPTAPSPGHPGLSRWRQPHSLPQPWAPRGAPGAPPCSTRVHPPRWIGCPAEQPGCRLARAALQQCRARSRCQPHRQAHP